MNTSRFEDEGLFDALPETGVSARLRDRLVAEAEHHGLLDVAYRLMDTPVGVLLLASTDVGLVRVAFAQDGPDAVLESLAVSVSPRVLHAPARLDETARQVDDYFARRRTAFDLTLDWRLTHGFRRTVLEKLPTIHYGDTASYAQIAVAAGSPRAVRAVGTACTTNPLPLVVPCHRVVRSDGSSGGYVGGPEAKNLLLSLETA
jgi:methylated-DNA-[protein]-cysteine S-methyltransferase